MRLISRTVGRELIRDITPLAAGAAVTGASFGAIAVAAGLPWWIPIIMSVFVFAGGSQFLAVGVIAAGGGPIAAVVGGLVLNARHLPFGLALGDVFGGRWWSRLVGAHLLIDETVAISLAQPNQHRARISFWACGVAMFISWNLGTVVGAMAGQVIGDPGTFGIDAAFPAALLALTLPSLRDALTLRAAAVGAVIAVATTPFLPGGLPVLLALAGLLVAGKTSRHDTAEVSA